MRNIKVNKNGFTIVELGIVFILLVNLVFLVKGIMVAFAVNVVLGLIWLVCIPLSAGIVPCLTGFLYIFWDYNIPREVFKFFHS